MPRNCEMMPIPKVYNSSTKKLNCKGLKIAIVTISQVLALQNKGFAGIFRHPIINEYKALTSPLFEVFIDWWITETLENLLRKWQPFSTEFHLKKDNVFS